MTPRLASCVKRTAVAVLVLPRVVPMMAGAAMATAVVGGLAFGAGLTVAGIMGMAASRMRPTRDTAAAE